MPGEHALLSPSSTSRWMACPPSARLEASFLESSSVHADEGTLCHDVSDSLFKEGTPYLPIEVWREYKKHELYTQALYDHACDYAAYVRSHIPKNGKHLLFAEKKLILSRWIPEGFGRGDAALAFGNTLHVFDLKYGKGVLVPYKDNKQLRVYALGWLKEFDLDFHIEEIHLHIYQPRMDNIGFDTITRAELMAWAQNELKPKALLAFEGKGEFAPGDHCKFCKARYRCKALAEYNLELAKLEFQDPNLLNDQEIADVLKRQKLFTSWLKDVSDYALNEAVANGVKWPGFKLVEGRSDRVYKNENEVANSVIQNLHNKDIYKPKQLIGITEMKAKIGSIYFKRFVEPYLIKPEGKPTLVPESDPRPIYNSASEDFSQPFVEDWMR
jgi:hypothetical protein